MGTQIFSMPRFPATPVKIRTDAPAPAGQFNAAGKAPGPGSLFFAKCFLHLTLNGFVRISCREIYGGSVH